MERVVFMGTPDFAVPALEAVGKRWEVTLVVTQPDRPSGRRRTPAEPAVKVAARELELPVYQPETLRSAEALAVLQQAQPAVIVVAAFGQILPKSVLDLPPHGCLNIHASLLPRYRGAAPVAAAILAGDDVTGVSIMLMDPGLDTGPVLTQAAEPIRPDDTTGTLTARLARLGADLLVDTLPRWLRGELTPQPQDEAQVTYAPRITKEDGLIDWTRSSQEIARAVRAFDPWPGAYTYWNGQRLRIIRAEALPQYRAYAEPGTVIETPKGVAVVSGEGVLLLHELQLAGKCCLDCASFVRGQPRLLGSVLGATVEHA